MRRNRKTTRTGGAPSLTQRIPGGMLSISAWTERIVRVVFAPDGAVTHPAGLSAVIAPPGRPRCSIEGKTRGAVLTTAELRVEVDAAGVVTFRDARGTLILAEAPGRAAVKAVVSQDDTFHLEQPFAFSRGEGLYGLGQFQAGVMNWRGHAVNLAQRNTEVAVPLLVSSRGYGILWDNMSETLFSDTGARKGHPASFRSEVGEAIDYYFVYGPSLDEVIAGYRHLTGQAPLYPRWAFGLFQCRERYNTQQELLDVAAEYRRRRIPLDCIVQDWFYWNPYEWGSHRFDPERYPDPAGMIQQLHDRHHLAFMISVWAKFEAGSENHGRMSKKGFLYDHYVNAGATTAEAYYDAFNPEARKLYWNQMNNQLFTKGVDGWWLDATEPEMHWQWSIEDRKRHQKTAAGAGARVLNGYPLMTTGAVYEGQRSCTSAKRVYILTRSAYLGQQRHAATTWSGDIQSTWETFRAQIPAGLNFCMAGIPYWTTDIGGFYCKYDRGCDNPEFRELFTRWFQYGAFCPIFRVHGTLTPREMWRFGDKGSVYYETQLAFDKLRYRLLPWIYSLGRRVTTEGYTLMRGLVMDFPRDARVLAIADQYMFGPAFLVNPVTTYRARTRRVYLPGGCAWYDFWTGHRIKGGRTITAAAPIRKMPLYVKAGSILLMGPEMQYATERPADPIEIRVYPGADASFTLYEDGNDGYDYEHGAYASIGVAWSDSRQELTIGDRAGAFPGMLAEREFRTVIVRPGHGVGIGAASGTTVRYAGSATTIRFNGTALPR